MEKGAIACQVRSGEGQRMGWKEGGTEEDAPTRGSSESSHIIAELRLAVSRSVDNTFRALGRVVRC